MCPHFEIWTTPALVRASFVIDLLEGNIDPLELETKPVYFLELLKITSFCFKRIYSIVG